MSDHLSHHPLLLLAASFAAGIVLAQSRMDSFTDLPFWVFAGCACLLAGLLLLRFSREVAAHAALLLGFVAAGGAAMQLFEMRFSPQHVRHLAGRGVDLADPVRLEGRVVSLPERTPEDIRLDLEVDRVESLGKSFPTEGRIRLRLIIGDDHESMELADALRLGDGDQLRVMAQIRKPRAYRNPGSFDYPRWLESVADIPFTGITKSPHLVEKLNQTEDGKLVYKVRHRLLAGIDQLFPPWSREGAVIKAVLLGDRSSLSHETVENFRRTGLYHMLVVSGLQLALLAFLAGLVLRAARLREELQIILLLATMVGYALLLEQRAPTLRATLMIFAYLVARYLYRSRAALNAVGASALILLVVRPFWVFESGFQLSFAAVLLITGLAVPVLEMTTERFRRALRDLPNAERDVRLEPRLAQFRLDLRSVAASISRRVKFLERHPAMASRVVTIPVEALLWMASGLLFSAIVQVGLLLPMTETFHRVTIAGILLNAVATPLMTVLLGLAAPTVALSSVSPALAWLPGKALSFVTGAFVGVAEFHGLPGWVSYRVPGPPLGVSLGFAAFVVGVGWTLMKSRRLFWFSVAGAGVFAVLISIAPFPPRIPRGALEVTALDCGGGDALFVVLPDQTTMLVDGCGARAASPGETGRGVWDQGENIVSPYLWSRGITRIDRVVLSHARQDHLGGLNAVFRNFQVGEFWHARNPMTSSYVRLLREADALGIRDRQLAAGELIDLGGARIEVLWPPPGRPPGERADDDDSLVMRIFADGGSILLAGDMGSQAEAELIHQNATLRSQILKVPGHGTRNSLSRDFLERVRPSIALVTEGSGGSGDLPSVETLERLEAAGVQVYQPALRGAVTAQSRNGILEILPYTQTTAH